MNEKRHVKAILNSDLQELLEKFEQKEDFVQNKIQCQICSKSINEDNVGSVQLKNNNLVFTCDQASCYNQMVSKQLKDKI